MTAVLAMRGCGKSAYVRRVLDKRKPRRLAIWDTKREHAAQIKTANLGEALRAMQARTFSVAFYPDMADEARRAQQFDLWCKAVYMAGRCTALVEELAFVTKPSKAPPGWRKLSLLGREAGGLDGGFVDVIATAQRPASIDKDFLGNCSVIHAGRLPWEPDAVIVGRALGVSPDELMQLPPLHWIERGEKDTAPRRGVLSFEGALGAKPKARNSTRGKQATRVDGTNKPSLSEPET